VHDVGTLSDGRVFYAMKFVEGQRLDKHVEAVTSLPDRLRLFLRICDAVAFAHARGVLHRDLKPANVMVGAFGEVLVMDWGLAKILREQSAEERERLGLVRGCFALSGWLACISETRNNPRQGGALLPSPYCRHLIDSSLLSDAYPAPGFFPPLRPKGILSAVVKNTEPVENPGHRRNPS
jgi:serine/threonine protein kinase